MSGWCQTAYIVFELAAVPVLLEFLFHGAMFQSLRQFGTVFAIIFTAVLNMAMLHNPEASAAIFVTSAVAGWSVWKSGSLLTGLLVHTEARVIDYIIFRCNDLPDAGIIPAGVLCALIMLAAGAAGFLVMQLFGKKKLIITTNDTFLSMKAKAKIAAWYSPMVVVWIICLLLFLVEIVM